MNQHPPHPDASPVPEQLKSALRTFLVAFAAYGAGKGWFDATLASAAIPMIMIGAPVIWNQLKIRRRYK